MSNPADLPIDAEAPRHESLPSKCAGGRLQILWLALAAALFGAAAAGACAWAAEATLGLFFGPLAFAAILVPPLAMTTSRRWGIFAIAIGMTAGISAVWLARTGATQTHLLEWAECTVVLAAFCLSLAGAAALLGRHLPRWFDPSVAAAIVIILALAWLTWPIWLAPALAGESSAKLVAILTPANPLFAINGILYQHLGVWAQFSLAYNLTDLGEIPYSLPTTILSCVLWHGIIGAALLYLSGVKGCGVPANR